MIEMIARLFLKITGWKLAQVEGDLRKAVVVFAPHTSSWDLFYGMAIVVLIRPRVSWIAKQELFRFPFGAIIRKFGGIPLDREHCHDTVQMVCDEFKRRDEFFFALSPEGTRAYRPYWRSGFYHMALEAQVPVVLGFLDYRRKIGGFGKAIHLTGDVDRDLKEIADFYRQIEGRHPEKFAPVVFRSDER